MLRGSKVYRSLALAVVCLKTLPGVFAQAGPAPTVALPAFDVVSVKPNKSGTNNFRSRFFPSGDVEVINASLLFVIRQAFSLYNSGDDQITGLPPWATTDRYDIQAKVSEADAPKMITLTQEQRGQMLQALLADRFKMVAHAVTREMPVYALVIARGGTKLHEADPANTYSTGLPGVGGKGAGGAGMMRMGTTFFEGQAITLGQLLGILTQNTGRTVIDKTGLTGKYDISLKWTPDETSASGSAADAGPSLFTAIQEQLGLRLDSQRGPVPGVVIEHIERPTEN